MIVQWNLHIPDTIGTHATCPDYRGVLNSEVPLYRLVTFGTRKSVLNIEVSLFQRCPQWEVPLNKDISKIRTPL